MSATTTSARNTALGLAAWALLAFGCDGAGITDPSDGAAGLLPGDVAAPDAAAPDDASGGGPELDAEGELDAGVPPLTDAGPGGEEPEPPIVFCLPDEPCDDLDPCTTGDVCVEGICAGTPYTCEDDGVPCTLARCDGAGGCAYPVRGDACLIEGECFDDGEPHPELPCWGCVSPLSQQEWSPDDTLLCEDGDPCTGGERCADGDCVGGKPISCDDGNPCTADACEPGTGCVHTPTSAPCSDGDPCTLGDACHDGACVPGTGALHCDDGNLCTDDACEAGLGCVSTPNQLDCDDGDACTLGDTCSGGACAPGPGALVCADDNPCTDDACDAALGCVFAPNDAPCDDGNACTVGDTCVGGGCMPGLLPLLCDDGNVCTDDACEPAVGCVTTPNSLPCDDGDICTVGDQCAGGACVSGSTALECDDGNPCTDDGCHPLDGCFHIDNTKPCDDGQACTTGDQCQGGACVGIPKVCDDGNACTTDACEPATGQCKFTAISDSFECVPIISILTPARAASLTGNSTINVAGTVISGGGAISVFTINGVSVPVQANGSFSTTVAAKHGLNLLEAYAADTIGNQSSASQSFYYSTKYAPVNPATPMTSAVLDGLMLRLAPSVIDSGTHNPSNPKDLATVVELLAASFDLQSQITNPIGNVSGVRVDLQSLTYSPPKVNLAPINGGLAVKLTVNNLQANLKFTYQICYLIGCSDVTASGKATATSVVVDTDLFISVNPNTGVVTVTAGATNATVNGLNVSLDGVIGFLTNWILGFFQGTFKGLIESAFEDQIGQVLPGVISEALSSLAIDQDFDIPALVEGAQPVQVSLESRLSSSNFTPSGGILGLRASVVASADQPIASPGALRRNGCGSGTEGSPSLNTAFALQIALHDDVLNQILYSLWLGGGLRFPVDDGLLAGVSLPPGIGDVELDVDFLLPPIIHNCTTGAQPKLQVGDIRVDASLKIGSIPVALQIFASLQAGVQFVASGPVNDKQLGIDVTGIDLAVTDLVYDDGALLTLDPVLRGLIEGQLVPQLVDALTGSALSGFPIPDIDLSFIDGVPPGTVLALNVQGVVRSQGYTVLRGSVK